MGNLSGDSLMGTYAFVVLSNPVAGREEEYNEWYSSQHLADVTAVPGFVAAQRFRLQDAGAENAPAQRYMAIDTIQSDDPQSVVARLTELVETGEVPMSDAFSMDDMAIHLYEAITPIVSHSDGDNL